MEIYKKISLIRVPEDADDVRDELIDRFGDLPKPTERLLDVALAKAIATEYGIERVESQGGNIVFMVKQPNLALWSEVFSRFLGMRFGPTGDRVIFRTTDAELAAITAKILTEYHKAAVDYFKER